MPIVFRTISYITFILISVLTFSAWYYLGFLAGVLVAVSFLVFCVSLLHKTMSAQEVHTIVLHPDIIQRQRNDSITREQFETLMNAYEQDYQELGYSNVTRDVLQERLESRVSSREDRQNLTLLETMFNTDSSNIPEDRNT
jgi:N-acetylglutamate synthase-like GNAT family acetyltransferase